MYRGPALARPHPATSASPPCRPGCVAAIATTWREWRTDRPRRQRSRLRPIRSDIVLEKLRRITDSPIFNIPAALGLILASIGEVRESFSSEWEQIKVGVHHGVFLYGVLSLIKGIPDLGEAMTRVSEAKEKARR